VPFVQLDHIEIKLAFIFSKLMFSNSSSQSMVIDLLAPC